MVRHKDADWNLPEKLQAWDQVQVAVLMDIRDELKKMNGILNCTNFLDIPRILRGIRRKLPEPKRRKRGR